MRSVRRAAPVAYQLYLLMLQQKASFEDSGQGRAPPSSERNSTAFLHQLEEKQHVLATKEKPLHGELAELCRMLPSAKQPIVPYTMRGSHSDSDSSSDSDTDAATVPAGDAKADVMKRRTNLFDFGAIQNTNDSDSDSDSSDDDDNDKVKVLRRVRRTMGKLTKIPLKTTSVPSTALDSALGAGGEVTGEAANPSDDVQVRARRRRKQNKVNGCDANRDVILDVDANRDVILDVDADDGCGDEVSEVTEFFDNGAMDRSRVGDVGNGTEKVPLDEGKDPLDEGIDTEIARHTCGPGGGTDDTVQAFTAQSSLEVQTDNPALQYMLSLGIDAAQAVDSERNMEQELGEESESELERALCPSVVSMLNTEDRVHFPALVELLENRARSSARVVLTGNTVSRSELSCRVNGVTEWQLSTSSVLTQY